MRLKSFAWAILLAAVAACGTGSASLVPGSDAAPALTAPSTATPPTLPPAPGSTSGGSSTNPNSSNPNPGGGAVQNGNGTTATPMAGAATFTGNIDGTAFNPTNAIFAVGKAADGSMQLAIKISDQADDCSVVTMKAHRAGAKSLWLYVSGQPMGSTTVTLGDSSDDSYANFYALDTTCVSTLSTSASTSQKGTLDLQFGDPNSMATGQYTLVMGAQGDQVAGTFAAAPCAGLQQLITNPAQMRTCE